MTNNDLTMDAPGASAADIQRGISVAQAVFEKAGTTAKDAAWCCWERERRDVMDGADAEGMTDTERIAADAWYEAHTAAIAESYRVCVTPSPDAQIKLTSVRPDPKGGLRLAA